MKNKHLLSLSLSTYILGLNIRLHVSSCNNHKLPSLSQSSSFWCSLRFCPTMPSISQGLVFAAAMVVSSTLLFLAYSRHKSFPLPRPSKNQNSQQPEKKILRSCLLSGTWVPSLLFFFALFFSFIMVLNVCVFFLLLL